MILHVFFSKGLGKLGSSLFGATLWSGGEAKRWDDQALYAYLTNMFGTLWSPHTTLVTSCPPFPLPGSVCNKPMRWALPPHTNSLKMGVLLNCMSKTCVFPCTFWRVAVFFLRKKGATNLEIARIRSKVLMFFIVLSILGTVTALLVGGGMQVPCCLNLAWAFGWATYHWANIMHIQLKWELTLNLVTLDALVSQF